MFDPTTMFSGALGHPAARGATSPPSTSSASYSFVSSVFFTCMFPPTIFDLTSSAVLPSPIHFSHISSAMLPSALANCVNRALRPLLVPNAALPDCVCVFLRLVVLRSTIFCFKFFSSRPLLATPLASTLFRCSKFFTPTARTHFCFNLLQAMQA